MSHPFLHASAPAGMKCSDCTMDKEPCPLCYSAGWKMKHPNTLQIHQNDKDTPLRCNIEGEAVVIRIGIDVIAFAAENLPELFDQKNTLKVCNKIEFARDVVRELNSEEEDGSGPLSNLFDKASIDAWENGSLGCHE